MKIGPMFRKHLENVIMIADDIMVVGKQSNHKDHDIALTQLLKTARECNVHLNYDKLQYKQTELDFFSETYTINGRKPSQSKVKAIQDMPPPQSKKQVQSFTGMVNYLSKFSAQLSELAELICELSKERVPFNWGLEHDEAFSLIKKEVTAAPILAYYNPNKPMVFQTDASCKGQGVCLLQNEKPVYFASKALTEMQKGYVARVRITSGLMGYGKIPSFLIQKPIYPRNRPETLGGHTLQKLKTGHTTTSKNPHQDISIQFQDKIYPRGQPTKLPIAYPD